MPVSRIFSGLKAYNKGIVPHLAKAVLQGCRILQAGFLSHNYRIVGLLPANLYLISQLDRKSVV